MNRRNRVHESRQIAYVQYLPLKRRRGINIYVFKHIIPQNRNMRVMLINVMAFHPGENSEFSKSPLMTIIPSNSRINKCLKIRNFGCIRKFSQYWFPFLYVIDLDICV